MACGTCARIATRDEGTAPLWDAIHRTECWDVVHCYDTSLPGWIVLVARRHIESIDELSEEESSELGRLLRAVSGFLREEVKCSKTYVMQFAEHPDHPHVHFHVVPRMLDMPSENISVGVFNYLGAEDLDRVPESRMNSLGAGLRGRLRSMDFPVGGTNR